MTIVRRQIALEVDREADQAVIPITRGEPVFRELLVLPFDYGGALAVIFDASQHVLSIELVGASHLLGDQVLAGGSQGGAERTIRSKSGF